MLGTHSPNSVLRDQFSKLASYLPEIREGHDEAIHDARVATRRIREMLPLVRDLNGVGLSGAAEAVQRAARALGRARDADVMHDLLSRVEDRVPSALPVIAALRRGAAGARQDARRRVIKEFEALDLAKLQRRVNGLQRWDPFTLPLARRHWRESLHQHIAGRAVELRQSMQRAGGVYFPNRSHATRLAIKKLRYALELAYATRGWEIPRAMRRLRKAQDALGQAHDRHVLRTRL